MSNLIESINDKAREMGYDFTFLIPASVGLRRYYRDRGYVEGAWLVKNLYTEVHDFSRDFAAAIKQTDPRIKSHKEKYFDSIACLEVLGVPGDGVSAAAVVEYVSQLENSRSDNATCLLHSTKDLELAVEEIIGGGGSLYAAVSNKEELRAVAFAEIESGSAIKIKRIYSSDNCAYYRLLKYIKDSYPELRMEVWESPDRYSEPNAVWSDYYPAEKSANGKSEVLAGVEMSHRPRLNVESYAMFRFLRLSEILKFAATNVKGRENSILVKEPNSSEYTNYRFTNGKLKEDQLTKHTLETSAHRQELGSAMSPQDVAAILCRKPENEPWILEAFGLPRLAFDISLMLD